MKTIFQSVTVEDPDTGRVRSARIQRQVLEPSDVEDIVNNVDLDGVVKGAIDRKEEGWAVLYQRAVEAVTQVVQNQASILENQRIMMESQQAVIEELRTRLEQLTETVEALLPEEDANS